jgi:Zn-dependent protease
MEMYTPEWFVAIGIVLLVSFPVHEWAHALTAYKLGDDTAALQGRLTLNPIAHWDLFGTIVMFFTPFGWAKPVPVSPYRLRGNMRASWALVSAAGPFSNLVMATLAAIPFRMGWLSLYTGASSIISVQNILLQFILINLSLMIFNLIPIPPLDGSRILAWMLPPAGANVLYQLERYGGVGLMMVLFLLSRLGFFSYVVTPVIFFIIKVLFVY